MKLYTVRLRGISPLLQHRFSEEAEQDLGRTTRRVQTVRGTPREEAEKCAYRTNGPGSTLWHPGAALGRLMREAGSAHKQRGSRKTLKWIVPAAVLVLDDQLAIYDDEFAARLTDFEVDSRPVVIPATKGRVMRHRPRLDSWGIEFGVRVNEQVLDPDVIHQLLREGGEAIGIGDFRPEKGGPFGVFSVVLWEQKHD